MSENRLIHEKSPYLLQHSHNPVQWYPWKPEAFQTAQAERKPIFLSIGYSTCHWCHVMEKESFEDEEVAAILNANFICIKVDREERPDIDAVYMSVCQAMSGSGGWPMTILMTPDKKPFFAGTYFPKYSGGMIGLMDLLPEICRLWNTQRDNLVSIGNKITQNIASRKNSSPSAPTEKLLKGGVAIFKENFDACYGGFFAAPKFPTPHNLLFLMKYYESETDTSILQMVKTTLTQMARGGIFDQIGGGFSRYSTDSKWLVPHFEKMLYDNALLCLAYTEGFRLTDFDYYRTIACRILDYISRELTGGQGGFYCGQDADSDGTEGKYYVFTPAEVLSVLGSEIGKAYCAHYNITKKGNFEGKSIPNLLRTTSYARDYMAYMTEALYRYRLERTKLHLDDKILTSWNALAIAAFAKAARMFQNTAYLRSAQRACQFIDNYLTNADGRLYVRWRDGEAAFPGGLDDYAFFIWALLELYAADFNIHHLKRALTLTEIMINLFWDSENNGFYLYAHDAEQLISRPKELYDGALPSGNSVAAYVLIRLSSITGSQPLLQAARKQSEFIAGSIADFPASHSFSLYAVTELLYPPCHLVCALRQAALPAEIQELSCRYALILLIKTPQSAEELTQIAPFTADMEIPQDGIRYYLCKDGACCPPAEDLNTLLKYL